MEMRTALTRAAERTEEAQRELQPPSLLRQHGWAPQALIRQDEC